MQDWPGLIEGLSATGCRSPIRPRLVTRLREGATPLIPGPHRLLSASDPWRSGSFSKTTAFQIPTGKLPKGSGDDDGR